MESNNETVKRYESMLTHVDNPFDYFTQREEWRMCDIANEYYCCERLARIAKTTEDMTQKEEDEEIERAIDEIIFYDPIGIYKKVKRETAI